MKIPNIFIWQPKRNDRQIEALKNAKRYFESDPDQYADTMFCPYCGEPLIKSGQKRRFETLSEHVSNPNETPSLKDEFICSAKGILNHQYKSDMIGCEFGILHAWNGDTYGGLESGGNHVSEYWIELLKLTRKDIVAKRVIDAWMHEDQRMEFSAALNSYECEIQTSIYHKGLKDKVFVFPESWKYNILIEFKYNANSFGEVTEIHTDTHLVRVDHLEGSYTMKKFNYIDTWKYLYESDKSNINTANNYLEKGNMKQYYHHIHEVLKDPYNNDLIYRIHTKYARLKYRDHAKRLIEEYGDHAFESNLHIYY